MSGTAKETRDLIVIVDYDSRWPLLYEEEETRILTAIGPHVEAIEHVGSTAVPALAAKSIIDILIGVRWLQDAGHCIAPLLALGYEYVPEFESDLPERRYFRRPRLRPRTHHIHMVETTSEFWDRHLLFRDFLRAHREDARRYEELKRALAAKFAEDHEGYTDAKTDFVRSIEAKARAERAQGHGGANPSPHTWRQTRR